MRRFVSCLAAAAAGVLACAAGAQERPADTLPLWELGAGAAGAWLPDYRGSDEARGYVLPFPYFVYRGEFLRADREGVRAKFFEFKRVEMDLSLGGTVPVDSSSNRARAGMPDLRPTLEVGPVLIVHLAKDEDETHKLDLRMPLRRAITWEDGRPRDIGTLFFPNINLDRRLAMLGRRWNLGVVAGAYFGDRRYHDYFYGVAPEFATAERPAYTARSGFAGWQGIVALSARIGRAWVGGFIKGDSVRGAVFEDSPLVRKRENFSAGLGVSYVFSESERRVPASR